MYIHQGKKKEAVISIFLKFSLSIKKTDKGKWKDEPVNIELKPDAKPYFARPYSIPKVHEETMKQEVDRLVKSKF